MKIHYFILIFSWLCLGSSFYFNHFSFLQNGRQIFAPNQPIFQDKSLITQFAKKKSLFSDDLLKQVEAHLASQKENSESLENSVNTKNAKSEKEEKKKDKKKNKNKNNNNQPPHADDDIEGKTDNEIIDSDEQPKSNSKPDEKLSKSKNKSKFVGKAKFAPLSQPSYVSLGTHEVEVVYGNDKVLRNATFAVTTGDRLGLVGPNGSGKVRLSSEK